MLAVPKVGAKRSFANITKRTITSLRMSTAMNGIFAGCLTITSELITKAGLVFLISAPKVGSKRTSQNSPRLGAVGLEFNDVTALPQFSFFGFLRIFVVLSQALGLLGENLAALRK